MNKKQFNTGQHDINRDPNSRKHKSSNFGGQQNGISTVPITSAANNPQPFTGIKGGNKNIHIEREFEGKQDILMKEGAPIRQQIRGGNPKIGSLNNVYPFTQTGIQKKSTPVFQTTNNRSASPVTTNKKPPQAKIKQKCVICQALTQKCCSLCKKIFYCSAEHQQVDWHVRHKFECEGRARTNANQQNQSGPHGQAVYGTSNTNKFVFYSNNINQIPGRSNEQLEREMDYQAIQKFLQLLQQRLVLRSKIINQVSKLNDRTPAIVRESLVKQTQQLLKLSARITNQEFKPSFSRKITKQDIMEYSSQQWGSEIVISQIGVGLEYYSDLLLMVKMYHLCGMTKQARQTIISIGRMLEEPEQKNLFLLSDANKSGSSIRKKLNFTSVNSPLSPNPDSGFHTTNTSPMTLPRQELSKTEDDLSKTKNLLLSAIISISGLYNIDKTTQSAYKLYIKKIELEEGVWEQIYTYFNMGVWYMEKTYYDKSVKSFLYALELLDSHKKGTAESAVFKADCLFNIGIGYWVLGERILAIQNMQECYRVRMNSIGKNSMQSSYCLYHLAKWYKILQKWNQCLQYLDECHRIRKLYENQPNYQKKIEEIKLLIADVYGAIRKQKHRNKQRMDSRTENYFAQILQQQLEQEQRQQEQWKMQQNLVQKGTVASRLFRDDKEYVKFNPIVSEDFFNKLSNEQTRLLNKLFERLDERMEKSEAIGLLAENQFVASLDNELRDQFFKENQIIKNH